MAYLMLGCAGILWPEVLSDDHDDWWRINTYESPTDGGVAQRPALAEDDTEHRAVLRNVKRGRETDDTLTCANADRLSDGTEVWNVRHIGLPDRVDTRALKRSAAYASM
jgi:hypothetical protein